MYQNIAIACAISAASAILRFYPYKKVSVRVCTCASYKWPDISKNVCQNIFFPSAPDLCLTNKSWTLYILYM